MPVTFKHHRLSNGLTIVGEVDPAAHTSAAGFFVKTGARDEAPALMGVSHFLEHMMFKGTETLSADELNRAFDAIGARNNAYTSNEMTCFYAQALPEHMPRIVELLGTMMRPALRDADFTMERGVILEEIAMYKDNPFWVLYESCVEKHFGAHPLSHRVLGTTETITALARDEMAGYFDKRYAADNTVVSLAGRVDFEATCKQIEGLCAAWPATGPTRDASRPTLVGGEFAITDPKLERGYLLALCDGPSSSDPRRYAAALLAQVLGAADNSRFHWALIEPGLADEAQASFDPHDGFGEFFVFASGDPENLDEIWEVIQRELVNLIASITQDDLARLVNKIATAATVGGERPGDRMQRLGRQWTYLGEYASLEEELKKIQAVTLDDLRAIHKAYPFTPVTVGRLGPK